MSETENKVISKEYSIKLIKNKERDMDSEINSFLDKQRNKRRLQSYLSTEKIYTGPNMQKERDNFRSKATSFRLNKHF